MLVELLDKRVDGSGAWPVRPTKQSHVFEMPYDTIRFEFDGNRMTRAVFCYKGHELHVQPTNLNVPTGSWVSFTGLSGFITMNVR